MFDHFRFVLIWNLYEQRKEEFEKDLTFVGCDSISIFFALSSGGWMIPEIVKIANIRSHL